MHDRGDASRLVEGPEATAADLVRLLDAQPALQDAYQVLLRELCHLLGVDVSALWMPDEVRSGLRCAALWSRDRQAAQALERLWRSTTIAETERDTVPGRAWQSQVPVWTDDLASDRRYSVLDASPAAAVLAVPMQTGSGVLGVVELLSGDPAEPDARLQRALVVLATGIAAPLERRLAEESAGAGRARLEAALEAGRMGVWDWDIPTNRVRWGPTLEEVIGASAGDFGTSLDEFVELIHPADRDWVFKEFVEAIEGEGRNVNAEYRVLRGDGEHRWIHVTGRVVIGASGRVTAVTGVATDITERVAREQALRVQAAQLELVLEVSGLGAWGWHRESRTGWWSPSLAELFGVTPEEAERLTAAQVIGVIHPDDRRVFDTMIAAAEEGRDWEAHYRADTPTGTVWIRAWGRPLHDTTGGLWGMVGIAVAEDAPGSGDEPGARERPR